MKALLIDDEENSRITLTYLVETFCPQVTIVAQAGNVKEGIEMINRHAPDIVFLDIELHDESGFTILEKLSVIDFSVIFITAHNSYALRAIKFSALDYLLKPVDIEELKAAVQKAARHEKEKLTFAQVNNLVSNLGASSSRSMKISVSTNEGISYINLSEVVRCQADSNYTTFFLLSGEKLMVSRTLKEYEEILDPNEFMRIHHSHIINLSLVKKYLKGPEAVLMEDGSIIEISTRRKNEVLARLGKLYK
jgi:two-component system, LytTR family, response regulator